MWLLYGSVLVKKELHLKAKLLIYCSMYDPTLTSKGEVHKYKQIVFSTEGKCEDFIVAQAQLPPGHLPVEVPSRGGKMLERLDHSNTSSGTSLEELDEVCVDMEVCSSQLKLLLKQTSSG